MNDEQMIRAVIGDWLAATARGDVDQVLALMTDDVEFLTPGRPPFGKNDFEAQARAMAGSAMHFAPDIREIEIAGNTAIVRQRLAIEVTPPGGTTFRAEGHILSVFRKGADGAWRLRRDANFVAAHAP